jgi:hypothetical protein
MLNEATEADFYKWICERKAKEISNPDRTLNSYGQMFINLLRTDPDKVLAEIRETSKSSETGFNLRTGKMFIHFEYDKLCRGILESYKKHFLPLYSGYSLRPVSTNKIKMVLRFIRNIFIIKLARL